MQQWSYMLKKVLLMVLVGYPFQVPYLLFAAGFYHPLPRNQNFDNCIGSWNHYGQLAFLTSMNGKKQSVEDEVVQNKDIDPLTKASWYAVEAFGKLFKQEKNASAQEGDKPKKDKYDLTKPPSSLNESFERIKLDNERNYFLSGEVDEEAYATDCVFADPFVSFAGRDRFVENLQNLGSFITAYDAKPLTYDVDKENFEVTTKLMVKLELNLPWKPILAWPWGVKYVIDKDTYLITQHIESWDVSALEGVKQIFRKPTTTIRSRTK